MTNKSLIIIDFIKLVTLTLFTVIIFFPGNSFATSSVKASITINVGDPDSTARVIIEKAEELKGYFTYHADDSLRINIPVKHTLDLLTFIEKKGIVTDKTYDTEDFSTQLVLKKTTLKAREKVLEQYMNVLEDTGNKNIVSVETEVVKLAEKMEDIKGQIRYLEHCTTFAKISVYFSFHNRAMPTKKKDSSFAWLNTMDLQNMIWDFQNE